MRAAIPHWPWRRCLFLRSPLQQLHLRRARGAPRESVRQRQGAVPRRSRGLLGLPHDRSIGSYRPLPNVSGARSGNWAPFHHPWALHWINIVVHAVNAACVARIAFGLTRDRRIGWFAGGAFVTCAVLTEAVTGVVGIADVFGALGLLLALLALERSLVAMAPLVFCALTLASSAKRAPWSLPIVSWSASSAAPFITPAATARLRARRSWRRRALVLYTETRRHFFPTDPSPGCRSGSSNAFVQRGSAFLRWFSPGYRRIPSTIRSRSPTVRFASRGWMVSTPSPETSPPREMLFTWMKPLPVPPGRYRPASSPSARSSGPLFAWCRSSRGSLC